jgi:hypothetical protein
MYDPATGRFTQEDPIGLAGGMNLYGFAHGDPVNFDDPFGLCPPQDETPCRDQNAAEGKQVVKRAQDQAVEITRDGITYGQERGNPKKRDCSEFVCRAVGDPHKGSTHMNSRDFANNPNFRALGAGESLQEGDVLWQPRSGGQPGSGHVGIFNGSYDHGRPMGCEMGNSGATCKSVWGAGGWFEGGNKLTVYRPQVPKQ